MDDTLVQILARNHLSPPLKVRPNDATGLMFPFALEGRAMCAGTGRSRICRFTFIEDARMQAVALQDEIDIVAMFAGMFWLLCRIASIAVESGIFPKMDGGVTPQWNPDVKRSIELPRAFFDEGKPFDWLLETASWRSHPERQILFFTVLSVLFRFVTSHELGHICNDHGLRRNGNATLCIDAIGDGQPPQARSIASQAREIVADSFAFQRTINLLVRELKLKAELEMTKILRAKLLPTKKAVVEFVLTIAFLYFRISDGAAWHGKDRDALTHPPPPFRARALAGALHEHRHLNISQRSADLAVKTAVYGSEALVSVMLGIYPDFGWLGSVSGPDDNEHFRRIYDEIPRWTGPLANL